MSSARDVLLNRVKPIVDQMDEVLQQRKQAINFCIETASGLDDYGQKTAFMDAYNKAREETKVDDFEHMAPSEKMSAMITVGWEEVAKCETRSDLREWLVMLLGKPGVFNESMVNKACQRKKLLCKKEDEEQSQDK